MHPASHLRPVASVPLLVLVRGLNRRECCYPSKSGTVLPKVALLAIVVASAVTLHAWASTPQVGTSTYIALDPTLLRRKTLRPLRLMVRFVIWSPPLLMSGLGPRWSPYPLRLLRPLTFHLVIHLLHYSGLPHQSSKILDG